MKGFTKKLLCIALAIVMVMGLGVTALADTADGAPFSGKLWFQSTVTGSGTISVSVGTKDSLKLVSTGLTTVTSDIASDATDDDATLILVKATPMTNYQLTDLTVTVGAKTVAAGGTKIADKLDGTNKITYNDDLKGYLIDLTAWEDDTNTAINKNADVYITPTFAARNHNLTATGANGATTLKNASGEVLTSVNAGETVYVYMTPNDGYYIKGLEAAVTAGDDTANVKTIIVPTKNTDTTKDYAYSFTVPAAGTTATAIKSGSGIALAAEYDTKAHTVSAAGSNGTIEFGFTKDSTLASSTTAADGDTVYVKATPAAGYYLDSVKVTFIDGVTKDTSNNDVPIEITLSASDLAKYDYKFTVPTDTVDTATANKLGKSDAITVTGTFKNKQTTDKDNHVTNGQITLVYGANTTTKTSETITDADKNVVVTAKKDNKVYDWDATDIWKADDKSFVSDNLATLGTIEFSDIAARAADTVSVIVTPAGGQNVSGLRVFTDPYGGGVGLSVTVRKVSDNSDGSTTYSFQMPEDNVKVQVLFGQRAHAIEIATANTIVSPATAPTSNVKITSDMSYADNGDVVTVTLAPEDGYYANTVKVTTDDTNFATLAVTKIKDNVFTFTVPSSLAAGKKITLKTDDTGASKVIKIEDETDESFPITSYDDASGNYIVANVARAAQGTEVNLTVNNKTGDIKSFSIKYTNDSTNTTSANWEQYILVTDDDMYDAYGQPITEFSFFMPAAAVRIFASFNSEGENSVSYVGTGSLEGDVSTDVFTVTLPTVLVGDNTFDFIIDPQGLLASTDFDRYKTAGVKFEGDEDGDDEVNVYFCQANATVKKGTTTTQYNKYFTNKSDAVTIENTGTTGYNISVTAGLSLTNLSNVDGTGINLIDDPENFTDGRRELYLAILPYQDGLDNDPGTPVALAYSAANTGKASEDFTLDPYETIDDAYEMTWNATSKAYEYVMTKNAEDGKIEWPSISYRLTGEANGTGDWSGYGEMTASIQLTWTVEQGEAGSGGSNSQYRPSSFSETATKTKLTVNTTGKTTDYDIELYLGYSGGTSSGTKATGVKAVYWGNSASAATNAFTDNEKATRVNWSENSNKVTIRAAWLTTTLVDKSRTIKIVLTNNEELTVTLGPNV